MTYHIAILMLNLLIVMITKTFNKSNKDTHRSTQCQHSRQQSVILPHANLA